VKVEVGRRASEALSGLIHLLGSVAIATASLARNEPRGVADTESKGLGGGGEEIRWREREGGLRKTGRKNKNLGEEAFCFGGINILELVPVQKITLLVRKRQCASEGFTLVSCVCLCTCVNTRVCLIVCYFLYGIFTIMWWRGFCGSCIIQSFFSILLL